MKIEQNQGNKSCFSHCLNFPARIHQRQLFKSRKKKRGKFESVKSFQNSFFQQVIKIRLDESSPFMRCKSPEGKTVFNVRHHLDLCRPKNYISVEFHFSASVLQMILQFWPLIRFQIHQSKHFPRKSPFLSGKQKGTRLKTFQFISTPRSD